MAKAFDFFVLLAEMRTGSNHLETSLNAFRDLRCHGEMFNPVFMGHHNIADFHGYTMKMRDDDPFPLLDLMVEKTEGLSGFRFFHDHDPRVIDALLANPRCGKVVLTRNPLDSYLSLKIARETGQWRLVKEDKRRMAPVAFDGAEFDERLAQIEVFQTRVLHALQVTAQTAFYLRYEDINDLEVVNGLAAWLGASHPLDALPRRLKKQNLATISEKVTNAAQMEAHLAGTDRFGLSELPQVEPKRGPGVPGFVAAAQAPLLYMPLPGGPLDLLEPWLTALDGAPPLLGFSQKTLRPWMRKSPGFTSFTVVRHPLERIYDVFNTRIVAPNAQFSEIRHGLIARHGLPIPLEGPDQSYSLSQHAEAFAKFLEIVKQTLNGATSLRLLPVWASQIGSLHSMSNVVVPHRVIREPELADGLAQICTALGRPFPALSPRPNALFPLAQVHTQALEDIAMEAYRRDYLTLGFKRWARG
jgi:hypothetical protein